MQDELFIVEYGDGEVIDVQGDGGFSVFYSGAEAQDVLDTEIHSIGDRSVSDSLRVVRFVRDSRTCAHVHLGTVDAPLQAECKECVEYIKSNI